MPVTSELAALCRLTPAELQAALETGFLARERHRGDYRFRFRFRVDGRLCSRYLPNDNARVQQTRQLLDVARSQQALHDIHRAPRFLRLAKLALTTIRRANRARDRPAVDLVELFSDWQHFNTRVVAMTTLHEKGISMTAANHEPAEAPAVESSPDESLQPTIPIGPAVNESTEQPLELEEETAKRETTAAEWAQTADDPNDVACEVSSSDGQADVATSADQQQTSSLAQSEIVMPVIPKQPPHPGRVQLAEYDNQLVHSTAPEAWIIQSIRRKCESIAHMLVCASDEALEAAQDKLEGAATIEPPMSLACKILKEIDKLKPDRPRPGRGGNRGQSPPNGFR